MDLLQTVVIATTLLLLTGLTNTLECNTVDNLYRPVGADASFNFQYTIQPSDTGVMKLKVTTSALVGDLVNSVYSDGTRTGQYIGSGVVFTGNFDTGDLSFTLKNIGKSNSGLYVMYRENIPMSCVTLYVTDKPTKPVISPTSTTVSEGDTAVFTCTSSSTTVPTEPGLTMVYTWRGQGKSMPLERRYLVTGQTLSVPNVTKEDSDTFTCTVKEDRGLTSDESDPSILIVKYAPTDIKFNLAGELVTVNEGSVIPDITCTADCYPACVCSWSRESIKVNNDGVLRLGTPTVYRHTSGVYVCTCTNPSRPTDWTLARAVTVTVQSINDSSVYVIVGGVIGGLLVAVIVACVIVIVKIRKAEATKKNSKENSDNLPENRNNTDQDMLRRTDQSIYSPINDDQITNSGYMSPMITLDNRQDHVYDYVN